MSFISANFFASLNFNSKYVSFSKVTFPNFLKIVEPSLIISFLSSSRKVIHWFIFILISTSVAIALFSKKSFMSSKIYLGLTLNISPPDISIICFKISISLSQSSKAIKDITIPFSFAIFPTLV